MNVLGQLLGRWNKRKKDSPERRRRKKKTSGAPETTGQMNSGAPVSTPGPPPPPPPPTTGRFILVIFFLCSPSTCFCSLATTGVTTNKWKQVATVATIVAPAEWKSGRRTLRPSAGSTCVSGRQIVQSNGEMMSLPARRCQDCAGPMGRSTVVPPQRRTRTGTEP